MLKHQFIYTWSDLIRVKISPKIFYSKTDKNVALIIENQVSPGGDQPKISMICQKNWIQELSSDIGPLPNNSRLELDIKVTSKSTLPSISRTLH